MTNRLLKLIIIEKRYNQLLKIRILRIRRRKHIPEKRKNKYEEEKTEKKKHRIRDREEEI